MNKIIILKTEIAYWIEKSDVILLFLKSGKCWVCALMPFEDGGDNYKITLAVRGDL